MATSISSFGKPINYGDWSRYAGFDPEKPLMGAVMPPMANAPTFGQVSEKAKTILGAIDPAVASVANKVNATAVQDLNGDGMISDWEE